MRRKSSSLKKILYSLIVLMCGATVLGLVSGGKSEDTSINIKGREMTLKEERFISKHRILSLLPLDKKRFYREGPVYPFFSATDEIWVRGKAMDSFTPLVILNREGRANVLWINADPFAPWFNFSPDGNFVAYPGWLSTPGIWVLNLKERKTRLVAPEVLKTKEVTSFGVMWAPDSKHFLISRVSKELYDKASKAGYYLTAICFQTLGERGTKRLLELWNKYILQKGNVQKEESEELKQLLEKVYTAVDNEGVENFRQAVDQYLRGQEVRIVDVINGVEMKVFQPGWPKGWTRDGKWIYVERLPDKKLLKISLENTGREEQITPEQFYPFYAFPPLVNKWSVRYGKGKKGLYLKEAQTAREVKVDNRKIEYVEWNLKGDKLLYVTEGREFFEIWLFQPSTGQKRKVIP